MLTISKLTKGILNVYVAALCGAVLAAGAGNSMARAVYVSSGGEPTSVDSAGMPEYTLSETGFGRKPHLPDRDLGLPVE